jgi:hypothetical protein
MVLIVWAVKTPAEQLDQNIQSQWVPEYHKSELGQCSPDIRYYAICYAVYLNSSDDGFFTKYIYPRAEQEKLALISDDFDAAGGYQVMQLDFYHGSVHHPHAAQQFATSYCFNSKDEAVTALRGGRLVNAALLGRTGKCYVAVYEGDGPSHLN